MRNPTKLIDAVIKDMEHRLTEARLQVLAADITRKRLSDTASSPLNIELQDEISSKQTIVKLESMLNDLKLKRNILILRAQDADARIAIEKALLEAESEPAMVAIDMLSDKIRDAESKVDAIQEIRGTSSSRGGDSDA
ncbi:MAG: PspA/IM30 family protein [Armatimonadota bacterium]